MPQRHLIVVPNDEGGVTVSPLKEWLRQHPDVLPGIIPNAVTSHQLRNQLRARGWTMQETPTEIRLIQPGVSVGCIDEVLGDDEPAGEEQDAPYFSLEYQLRDFLASNIGTITINGERLRIYVDPTGRDGVEYPTAVGPIDILAIDDTGSFYVFELKRAQSSDRAMGQLARYMGWARQTIGRDRKVFGVIVAKTITENLRYAAFAVPDVFLYEYEVAFNLKKAN